MYNKKAGYNPHQAMFNNLKSVLNHTVGEANDGDNDENSFVCLVVPVSNVDVDSSSPLSTLCLTLQSLHQKLFVTLEY